jgi:hypothetical protein
MKKLLLRRNRSAAWGLKPVAVLLTGMWIILSGGGLRAWAAPAATATTLAITSASSAITTVDSGSVVTLTAAVKAGASPVTVGQVNFCDASAKYCTDIHLLGMGQLTSSGTAALKFIPGIGNHSYKAVFLGTTNGAASTSGTADLIVTGLTGLAPTATTIAQSGSAGNYTLTATVTGPGGLASPTGVVSFLDKSNGNALLGTAVLDVGTIGLNFLNSLIQIPVDPSLNQYSMAVGDFNGDGIPDLAVVNLGNSQVTILLGNGNGAFTPTHYTYGAGGTPYSVAVGDFNGDGNQDLAVAAYGGKSVTILLGNGDGTFTDGAYIQVPGYGNPYFVAVGDFNGDGIPDLAVTSWNTNSLTILLGNGKGGFTPAPDSPVAVGPRPVSVAVGDFNGDGIPDVAVAGLGSSSVSILLGNGNGSFTEAPHSPLAALSFPSSVAVGDFNGDGIPDVAVAGFDGDLVTILLGNGNGTFTPVPVNISVITGIYPAYSVAVGDFNGDGTPDLAVPNTGSDTLTILLGNGNGTFTQMANSPITVGIGPSPAVVADFNGDGIPDVAVANSGSGTVTVLLSQLTQASTAPVSGISPIGTGTHQVDAIFPGDSSYSASTSSTTELTAQQGTPTVTVTLASSSITTAQALSATVEVSGENGNPTPTGIVTLTGGSYTSAATTLSSGSAKINVPAGSLTTGTDTLTASYAGDGNYKATSGTAPVTVTTAVNPSLTISGTAVTVFPGVTTGNTSTITMTPIGGFTGSVALTASITASPAGAEHLPTLSFGATSPVSITGTNGGTATLTISTTAATSATLTYPTRPGVPWYAAGGTVLACMLLFGIPARRLSWQTMLGMLVFLVAFTSGVLACSGGGRSTGGGGTSNPGTTAGAYTVTVTGTSGTTTGTTTVSLTVQ